MTLNRPGLGFALVLASLGPWPILAASAADELAFHPCLTQQEQAFVEVELGRGPAVATGGESNVWEYAVVDLDQDGIPEVAVRPGEPCAGEGCRTVIYTRAMYRWVTIFETADRDISVARKQTKGYREILTAAGLWRWTGKTYRRTT